MALPFSDTEGPYSLADSAVANWHRHKSEQGKTDPASPRFDLFRRHVAALIGQIFLPLAILLSQLYSSLLHDQIVASFHNNPRRKACPPPCWDPSKIPKIKQKRTS